MAEQREALQETEGQKENAKKSVVYTVNSDEGLVSHQEIKHKTKHKKGRILGGMNREESQKQSEKRRDDANRQM